MDSSSPGVSCKKTGLSAEGVEGAGSVKTTSSPIFDTGSKKCTSLELVDVYSSGKGKITNVFLSWNTKNSVHPVFENRVYDVLKYLLENGYIDIAVVKNIVSLFESVECLRPVHVYVPVHVHHPLHVHEAKRR